jgi:serine protease Do
VKVPRSKTPQDSGASYSTGRRRLPTIASAPTISVRGVTRAPNPLAKKVAAGAALLVLAVGGGWVGAELHNDAESEQLSSSRGQQVISNESELIAEIAEETGGSVVSVDVQREVPVQSFFGPPGTTERQSAGTGFIVSSSGVIVTNRHVVPAGTTDVSVTLSDGTTFDDVEVIGRTSQSSSLDVAFLKIKDAGGKKLTAARLGDSSKIKVGDRVIAIGNALGQFQNSVTSGIISGFGRDVQATDGSGNSAEALIDLFQTDAAINEGNSGGPLVSINGEVIGINTAVAGGAQNIGFAIPINDVKGLISGVLASGQFRQTYLGVRYITLTDDAAAELDLKTKRGAYIAPSVEADAVLPGSPAAKAGLREGDIITKLNGIEIDEDTNLSSALGRFQVGDKVTLTVVRDGKPIKIQVTLEAAPVE